MHFWNTGALAQKLKEGSVKESEKMMSLLFLLVFSVLLLEADYWDLPLNIFVNDKRGSFVILIIIAGLLLSYYYNRKGDGRQFLERFICISWILTFKYCIFFYLGFIALAFSLSIFFNFDFNPNQEFHTNTLFVIEMITCLQVVSWIRWIADESNQYDTPCDFVPPK